MKYTLSKLRRALPVFAAAVAVMFLGVTFTGDDDIYKKIDRNMDLFAQVYREVALNYVDEIDADRFMEAGIEGMLSTLDPYTNYIDEKSRDQIDMITTGKYGGVGITVGVKDSMIYVTEIMNGYEAQKKGMRVGDKIIEIDGRDLHNANVESMRNLIRGPAGTSVNVKAERDGEVIEFNLTRQEIILKNVSYYGYIEPKSKGIAYVRLDRFTNITENEFVTAVKTLQSKGEMKAFILDLRDNGGGLLDAAIGILNKIVPKNSLLLITKGKRADSEKKYFSKEDPMIPADVPVAVLINGKTASASEIVAGAIQDLDRGVIVGTKSFGKGLVQQIKDLDKRSQIKITGSRYFTPSGRWIQEKNYLKENKFGVFLDKDKYDRTDFTTLGGRNVKAYGGITPDIEIKTEPESEIHSALLAKDMYFKFANDYLQRNPGVKIVIPSEELFADFRRFLSEKNFNYVSRIDKKIGEIEQIASDKKYSPEIKSLLDKVANEVESNEQKELESAKEEILSSLVNEINLRIISESEQIEATFPYDKQLQEAVRIVSNVSEYNSQLGR